MLDDTEAHTIKARSTGFWQIMWTHCRRAEVLILVDSHAFIQHIIRPGDKIWNFDQHHDCGYNKSDNQSPFHCGNWAIDRRKIAEYHLVYPEWRRKNPEKFELVPPTTISFEPRDLPEFDVVFVCRSSAWTPSWCDLSWMSFLDYLRTELPELWNSRIATGYVTAPRNFDTKLAAEYRKCSPNTKKSFI